MTARLELLEWAVIGKGALIGKAKIRLPNRLEISDVAVFVRGERRWAQLPAEPMRDNAGQIIKGADGKTKYRSSIRWSSRELQDGFSSALLEIIEAAHGPLGGGAP